MVIESYIGGELSIDHGKMLIAVFLQVESFFSLIFPFSQNNMVVKYRLVPGNKVLMTLYECFLFSLSS